MDGCPKSAIFITQSTARSLPSIVRSLWTNTRISLHTHLGPLRSVYYISYLFYLLRTHFPPDFWVTEKSDTGFEITLHYVGMRSSTLLSVAGKLWRTRQCEHLNSGQSPGRKEGWPYMPTMPTPLISTPLWSKCPAATGCWVPVMDSV